MSLSLLQLHDCASGYYDNDPVLMNDELLQRAVAEQFCQIARAEEIDFDQVTNLCLGYKDIAMIDNLRNFPSLTRLQLNNNLIEKIKGLEHLVNLTWLDLSFNRIEKIEGLESLLKLEVLNLSDNRISAIENMDKLETLTNFFIANNLLRQLDNVCYLRKFKNLFNLNLCGNPISKEEDYIFFIAAYLPNLKCLDYRLLSEKTKNEASSKYHYALEKMRDEELKTQQAHDAEKNQKAELQLHKDAFVELLNGPYFFKNMLKDDPESEILHSIPKVAHLLQTFEQQMVDLCMQLFEIGLAEHKRRETEVNSFFTGYTKAERDYQQTALQILEDFEEKHTERKVELQQLSDLDVVKVKMSQCKDEISKLSNRLMTLEFQMANQMEGIIKMLDVNISDMVGNFTETAQAIFAQCRDREDNYYHNVEKIIVATLEELAKDDLEDDLSEDARTLLTDKDTVMDALANAHDNHLLMITNRETALVTGVDAWKVALFKEIQEQDLKWHRMRVLDIHRKADYLREQLDELL